jgi:hypothetical protein
MPESPSGKSAQIALVFGIVLALLPWGLGLIGVTVNLPLGAAILFIAFALCVYGFWIAVSKRGALRWSGIGSNEVRNRNRSLCHRASD